MLSLLIRNPNKRLMLYKVNIGQILILGKYMESSGKVSVGIRNIMVLFGHSGNIYDKICLLITYRILNNRKDKSTK